MITLYHAPMARSVRARWMLDELGLPHQVATRAVEELGEPEHVALHPLGQVPVLVDGPLVLLESGAIVQYLLETYGHGRLEPDRGSPERAKFLQWIHFAEATLTPPLAALLRHERRRRPVEPCKPDAQEALGQANAALAFVEDALQGRDWLTGEFSAADVMMGYGLALAKRLRLTDELPNIKAYVARCEARPAFRRACKT